MSAGNKEKKTMGGAELLIFLAEREGLNNGLGPGATASFG